MNIFGRTLSICAAIASVCAITAPAAAVTVVDSINANATPFTGAWDENNVGWYYTPSASFTLTGIGTKFASVNSVPQLVSESLYSGTVGNLTLLGSGSFVASTDFAIPTFAAVALTAGHQYFFAFGNVAGLGSNLMLDPGATTLAGGLSYDFNPTEMAATFANGPVGGGAAQPIVQFFGLAAVSAAPEPGTWIMMIIGFGLAGASLRTANGGVARESTAKARKAAMPHG